MKKSILLLMMLAAGRLFAQSHAGAAPSVKHSSNNISVSGRVKDTAGTALPGATVKLKSGNDSLIAATNIDGIFTFAQVKKGSFTLTVSNIGYRTLTKKITKLSNSKNLVLDAIVLKPEQKVLQAITINGTSGVVYKADTVLYKASPYKVNQNAQVNELLKKMENFQVGT